MRQKSRRVIRFVIIQFIALIGWIAVQSFFSLSPVGRALPFILVIFIEAVWWSGLLFIMLLLFLIEYNRFVQAAVDLEEANRRLRTATNQILHNMRNEHMQKEGVTANEQDGSERTRMHERQQ